MEIRKLEEKDLEQVSIIEKNIFSDPWSKKSFADVLEREDVLFLVAEENERILGYIGVYISLDEGEITNVAVEESQRKKGIGEKLLDELIMKLEERDVISIFLEVRFSNTPALSLYKKKGFKEVGIRKGFYDKPKEDAIIMLRQKE